MASLWFVTAIDEKSSLRDSPFPVNEMVQTAHLPRQAKDQIILPGRMPLPILLSSGTLQSCDQRVASCPAIMLTRSSCQIPNDALYGVHQVVLAGLSSGYW